MISNRYWTQRWGGMLLLGFSANVLVFSPFFRHPLPVAGVGIAGIAIWVTYLFRTHRASEEDRSP